LETAFIHTPIGWLQISANQTAVSSILFIEDGPQEQTVPNNNLLQETVQQLQAYFAGSLQAFEIMQHCNQRGTPFQQRVWNELVTIPFGKTTSYRQMAIRLGDEKCIRAAASANGQNQLAIVVPCHRVIGSNGSLTGYAGGLWRKKWLLEHEAQFSGGSFQGSLRF
jgi:methylated-DNA-[protein]-cysteine S-methyltransferase